MRLNLYYPVNPYYINQEFGESTVCTEDNNLPLTKRKVVNKQNGVCPVGYVELYPLLGMRGHTGLDLTAYNGKELYHCGAEGIVEEIQTEPERGLGIGIVTKEKFEFNTENPVTGGSTQIKLRYWHLKGFNVKLGDTVKLGDLIGWCDNTGLSTSSHLHFEVKPVAKDAQGNYYNIYQDNGYYGAINPKVYFIGEYAHIGAVNNLHFDRNLSYMDSGLEIKRLQEVLKRIGYFPFTQETTYYYGRITANSVYHFQRDHVKLTPWEYFVRQGQKVDEKTRIVLNSIIDNIKIT